MKSIKCCMWVVLVMVSVFFIGCADKASFDKVDKSQTEILAKLTAIEEQIKIVEGNQKKILESVNKKGGRPTIDYNKVHKIPIGNSPVRGQANAPVTIVEFSDFQCPYCSKLQSTLEAVLKAYPKDVHLVFKDSPLSFQKQAQNAAKAAHAAGEQGKYWEMHDLIFVNYNKLTEAKFEEYANKLGLDKAKFMADFKSAKYDKQIQQDMNLGRQLSVSGTPTLFLNGKRMKQRSLNAFKTTIDGFLKK